MGRKVMNAKITSQAALDGQPTHCTRSTMSIKNLTGEPGRNHYPQPDFMLNMDHPKGDFLCGDHVTVTVESVDEVATDRP